MIVKNIPSMYILREPSIFFHSQRKRNIKIPPKARNHITIAMIQRLFYSLNSQNEQILAKPFFTNVSPHIAGKPVLFLPSVVF